MYYNIRPIMAWIVVVVFLVMGSACSGDPLDEFNVNCIQALRIPVGGERPDVSRLVSYIGASDTQNAHLLQLSRHHIIPYATLRNFYNTMIHNGHRSGIQRLTSEVINALAPYAYRGRTLSLTTNENVPISDTISELTRTMLERPNFADIIRAHQIYAWMPFNIYVGPSPSLRDDDPGENVFDATAYTVVGNAVATRLSEIYDHMTSYLNSGNESEMNAALDGLRVEAMRRLVPYMFNRYYWRVRTDHITNGYRFALSTESVAIDGRYRDLTSDDFCMITEVNRRSNRRPRLALPLCIIGYTNSDAFCTNTLESVRTMIDTDASMYVGVHVPRLQPSTVKTPHACNYGYGAWPVPCH
ncbi:hypothetical protein [Trichoplusia ni ascovirus 2c]|uniref:hypothetical protein n=1 Tax=Trichoplusia ni ascovirus 2c TaxID=328615 RepID=UPI0000E44216|nr:hypothetical protein TNAV2c_gp062 [Trichoplusia ni ascovirus 2c]ABF70579.1 hypothetical protein [Trichoplusia ni ascovirus 2c]AUS94166.1 hypothetical protein [Trichoplusia ni ascovirus 6b]